MITGQMFESDYATTLASSFRKHIGEHFTMDLTDKRSFKIRIGLANKANTFRFNNLKLPEMKMEFSSFTPRLQKMKQSHTS